MGFWERINPRSRLNLRVECDCINSLQWKYRSINRVGFYELCSWKSQRERELGAGGHVKLSG